MMEGVMKNYRAQNSAAVRLQDSFDLKMKHVLVEVGTSSIRDIRIPADLSFSRELGLMRA